MNRQLSYRPQTTRRGWHRAFAALENRNFRWMWLAGLASSATFQIGIVARGWLIYKMTGSALALGWVSSGWGIAILITSLFGGVIADRARRRNVLVVCQIGNGLINLSLGLLIATHLIEVWHLFVASLAMGLAAAFSIPANDAFIAQVIDRETLLNASSLNSVAMSLMGILGAPAAGILLERIGAASAFFLQIPLFAFIVFCLLRLPLTSASGRGRVSVLRELFEGLRYIRAHVIVMILLGINLARVLFAMPYQSFLPVFSEDIFRIGASGLGFLQAAVGMGAMLGSLWVASLGNFRHKGSLLLGSGLVLGGALIAFSYAPSLYFALAALIALGAANNVCMVANGTLIQTAIPDQIRGRVLSMALWLWGFSPVGTVPAGALADRWGVPLIVAIEGALLALTFLAISLAGPRLRRLE